MASEAIGSSGDAAVGKRTSKRRSPSPSASPDNRPSRRFVERELDSGSEDNAESESTPMLLWALREGTAQTSVRSESPAVKAKGTPKAGGVEEKPRKRLSLAKGLARAKASKAEGAKTSKKRTASMSPLHEAKETRYPYRGLFDSSDEEGEKEGHINTSARIANDRSGGPEDPSSALAPGQTGPCKLLI
ncbi:hypothetical protein PInf_008190 [Phytophthora infestans]|nr:hypothetical protein PInf_008190 [Phytophthora infestans]